MNLQTRSFRYAPATANEANRTVEAVMATENPVTVMDYQRWEPIDEILRMDGLTPPSQVPLLDSHSRYSVANVLGSTREIRVENGQLVGCRHFADDQQSLDAWKKVAGGHVTDGSIGYSIARGGATVIKPGERGIVKGKTYTADPARSLRVVHKWSLHEDSVTPIGADAAAKHRSKEIEMETEVQKPTESPDMEAIRQTAAAEAVKAERQRTAELEKLAGSDVSPALLKRAIEQGWSAAEAAPKFLDDIRSAKPSPVHIGAVTENRELLRQAVTDALVVRSGCQLKGSATTRDKVVVEEGTRRRNAEDFRGAGFQEIARACVEEIDGNGRQRDVTMLFSAAIGKGNFGRSLSTVSFPEILQAGITATLAAAYEEQASTFLQWAGRREVSDFKQYKDLRLSAFAKPPEVGEGGELEHSKLVESKEVYGVKTYGDVFKLSRQQFINDSLGAFMRIPMLKGQACKRNIDDLGIALLLSGNGVGPTMGEDSKALFHATHTTGSTTCSNYNTGSTTTLDDTGLASTKALMMKIRGMAGERLNIMPRFLLVGSALADAGAKLMTSREQLDFTVSSGATVVKNVNVHYGTCTLLVDSRLDDGLATAYYLIADPKQAESLGVVYLRGNENPVIERVDPAEDLAVAWRCYHDAGVAALDWRGIVKSKGAV